MMRVEILVFEVATYTESSDATSSNLVKYEQGVAFYRYESRGKGGLATRLDYGLNVG